MPRVAAGTGGSKKARSTVQEQARRLLENAARVRIKLTSLTNNVVSRGQLNLPQFNALSAVAMSGPLNMTQLTEALCVSTAAATNVMDKLVDLGLAKRGRHKSDRRVVLVEATPKGRRTVEVLERDFIAIFSHLLERLSEEEREAFVGIYERLNRILWDEPPEVT